MSITPTELATRAGISVPYASQLLSDNPEQHREPSLVTALKIYDATGLQLGCLKELRRSEIDVMRKAAA